MAAATKMRRLSSSSSSEAEDSDVERNFALLTEKQRRGRTEDAGQHHEEEEEERADGAEEDGSDAGDEEEDEDTSGGYDEEKEHELDEEEGVDSDASEEDDGEDEGLETPDSFRRELANMSFEDIMKLQSKVGTRAYNKVAYGSSRKQQRGSGARLNKNRPTEISAKRPAPFLRQVVPVKKPTLRDPRFDDLSGEYRPEVFDQTYKFIHDIKLREKEVVKKQLKKAKSSQKKEKLQFLLKRMENQERARLSREQQRERELQFKQQQREQAGHGARPFFLKRSEKKKLQLAEKYQALKRSGKLETFLSKKRKRNAGKDRRKLPRQQQDTKAA
ncbi:ribosomal RNA processing protein 36 homolog [Betta splendens]|uniref:rRNA biogenesis protein RRP36 n=1 Tax=Betta splendens TaxID=158456 RepID=A0A6P7MVT9_BETSP|nr:ribosomal RNA processing protein 36 homolog [Betta splendens]